MISVVIPSYNRRECILELLSDVMAQEGADFEVVVVDDCSTDGSPEAIRAAFPQIRFFQNEVNGGPCVTRNRGIREAKGDLIVGLDSDVRVPDRDMLAGVVKAFAASDGPLGLALRLLDPEGNEDEPRWWHPVPIDRAHDREFRTSYFSGTAYAFRRDDMIRAGLFPEVFYMHYEEVELALRLLDLGVRIVHAPQLRVIHHAAPTQRRSRIQVFFKPRNQVLLALRCYPVMRAARYLLPRIAYNGARSVGGGHARDFFSALGSSLRLAPECLRERKPVTAATWKLIASLPGQELAGAGSGRENAA